MTKTSYSDNEKSLFLLRDYKFESLKKLKSRSSWDCEDISIRHDLFSLLTLEIYFHLFLINNVF